MIQRYYATAMLHFYVLGFIFFAIAEGKTLVSHLGAGLVCQSYPPGGNFVPVDGRASGLHLRTRLSKVLSGSRTKRSVEQPTTAIEFHLLSILWAAPCVFYFYALVQTAPSPVEQTTSDVLPSVIHFSEATHPYRLLNT